MMAGVEVGKRKYSDEELSHVLDLLRTDSSWGAGQRIAAATGVNNQTVLRMKHQLEEEQNQSRQPADDHPTDTSLQKNQEISQLQFRVEALELQTILLTEAIRQFILVWKSDDLS